MTFIKTGNFSAGERAFTQFLADFPQSAFVPYAHYWRGTAYFALHRYTEALSEQHGLLASFPKSPITPDALTNIAATYRVLRDGEMETKTRERILRDYPYTAAAVWVSKHPRK